MNLSINSIDPAQKHQSTWVFSYGMGVNVSFAHTAELFIEKKKKKKKQVTELKMKIIILQGFKKNKRETSLCHLKVNFPRSGSFWGTLDWW